MYARGFKSSDLTWKLFLFNFGKLVADQRWSPTVGGLKTQRKFACITKRTVLYNASVFFIRTLKPVFTFVSQLFDWYTSLLGYMDSANKE